MVVVVVVVVEWLLARVHTLQAAGPAELSSYLQGPGLLAGTAVRCTILQLLQLLQSPTQAG